MGEVVEAWPRPGIESGRKIVVIPNRAGLQNAGQKCDFAGFSRGYVDAIVKPEGIRLVVNTRIFHVKFAKIGKKKKVTGEPGVVLELPL